MPSSLKKSIADMQRFAEARGGACVSEIYVNNSTKLLWQCARGHRWEATPASVIRTKASWCPACSIASMRGTLEPVQEIAAQRGGRCLSPRYINRHTPLQWECAKGHRWNATPGSIKQGSWCGQCARDAHRLTIETMRQAAAARGGVCLSQHYVDNKTRLEWRCAKGHEWKAEPSRVMQGTWCLKCYHERQRDSIELMHELAAARGGRCLSTEAFGNLVKLTWECHRGHVWETTPAIIKQGSWCRNCAMLERTLNRLKHKRYDADE